MSHFYEINGCRYRAVKRPIEDLDYGFVALESGHGYTAGEVYELCGIADGEPPSPIADNDEGYADVYPGEYLSLEEVDEISTTLLRQREKKLALAINVKSSDELPMTAQYTTMFLEVLDPHDEYDVDIQVGVNAPNEPMKEPIGFSADALSGHAIEIELDEYDGEQPEEEPDGSRKH